MLHYKTLQESFEYDPIKGTLTSKDFPKLVNSSHGYIHFIIADRGFLGHKIAWAIAHDYQWPEHDIHCLNCDFSDLRVHNLILKSKPHRIKPNKPSQRKRSQKNNTSGVVGVHWKNNNQRWIAKIDINGKRHYLGYHREKSEAIYHRLAAEQCIGITIVPPVFG